VTTQAAQTTRNMSGAIGGFLTDLRYAFREFRRSRVFAAATVLILALGIGANTAIFSIVEAVLLRPLPYRNASRLVVIWQTDAAHRASGAYFNSYREFEAWQQQSRSFEKLAALTWATGPKSKLWEGKPIDVLALPASVEFFSVLGAKAQLGRTFADADLRNPCTLVLAYRFWQQRLGAPAGILGRSIDFEGTACTIIGVMPKRFEFYPAATDAWTLITPASEFGKNPWHTMVGAFGLLKPGVTRAAAEAELASIQSRAINEAPADQVVMRTFSPDVLDLQSNFTWLAGRNLRKGLWLLLAASALILLLVAVNVGGLMLGRAMERAREVAVRAALGSSRARIFRQSIAESLLLGMLGTIAGAALAAALLQWFRSANPVELPPSTVVTVDWRTLLFAAGVGMLASIVFAVLPTLHKSRINLNDALKAGSLNHSQTASNSRATQSLVVIQIALSMVLVVGAGMLAASFFALTSTSLGYRTDHLFTATIILPQARYPDTAARARFADAFESSLRALPGVESAAIASDFVPRGLELLSVAGKPGPENAPPDVATQELSPSFFQTLSVPLLRGRLFTDADKLDTQQVAIINEALAREYFPGVDPLGRAIKLGRSDDKSKPWLTVIGVVANVKTTTVFQEMGYLQPPAVYRPLAQSAPATLAIMVVIPATPSGLVGQMQQSLSTIAPALVLGGIDGMRTERAAELAPPRFRALLLSGFAVLALLLAVVGVYGTLSQFVVRRTREISIRMALGAQRDRVLFSILRRAIAMACPGVAIGAGFAALCIRFVQGMFYGIHSGGAAVFAMAAGLLVAVSLASALKPALRATSIDPMQALRTE
jgi:predicted permease